MGLLDFVGQVAKVTVRTVITPVELVKDVLTIGGDFTDGGESYTGKHLKNLADDIQELPDSITK